MPDIDVNVPEWATEKQKEGMKLLTDIAHEYGDFDLEFENYTGETDDSRFTAHLRWEGYCCRDSGVRHHTMEIAWDYEAVWDCYGERKREWQFLFGGGDAVREVSTEVFFVDLFFYLDKIAVVDNET